MVGFFKKSRIDGQHWDDLGSLHIFATIHDVSFHLSFMQFLIANSILERSIYLKTDLIKACSVKQDSLLIAG
jgi:hypothetical protein